MCKYQLLLIIFCFIIGQSTFSQYAIINPQESMIYTPEKLYELNKIHCLHLEKSKILSKSDSIYIYHIFHFDSFKKIRKEDLADPSFFKKLYLQPLYSKYRIRKGLVYQLPSSRAIILNDNDEFLGIGYPQFFTSASACSPSVWKNDLPLLKMGKNLNVRILFDIISLEYRGLITFGRTYDDRLLVFHKRRDEDIQVNSIDEFIEDYWDKYFD